jgi:hypothetical protein
MAFVGYNDKGFLVRNSWGVDWNKEYCRKIILTTDPRLIADGVQAIDDNFLEWFVKNSSCEFVVIDWSPLSKNLYGWKIIIPQEEPKGETLKEVSMVLYPEDIDDHDDNSIVEYDCNLPERIAFIAGAKWQAERMYSEEEVIELLTARCKHFGTTMTPFRELLLKQDLEWFEQNKKK